MNGIFLSVLKTTKEVIAFRNDSKLHYSIYHPISLLEKILEKRMYKKL